MESSMKYSPDQMTLAADSLVSLQHALVDGAPMFQSIPKFHRDWIADQLAPAINILYNMPGNAS